MELDMGAGESPCGPCRRTPDRESSEAGAARGRGAILHRGPCGGVGGRNQAGGWQPLCTPGCWSTPSTRVWPRPTRAVSWCRWIEAHSPRAAALTVPAPLPAMACASPAKGIWIAVRSQFTRSRRSPFLPKAARAAISAAAFFESTMSQPPGSDRSLRKALHRLGTCPGGLYLCGQRHPVRWFGSVLGVSLSLAALDEPCLGRICSTASNRVS
jgi:hypothetical protein